MLVEISARRAAGAGTLGIGGPLSIRQSPRAFQNFCGARPGNSVSRPGSRGNLPFVSESAFPAPPQTLTDPPKVEAATIEDLPALVELVVDLFAMQDDFTPDRMVQERGLALILEQPSRGRIFVLRNDHQLIGMVNLLFTISTAMGGFVIQMEDVIVHPDHRGQGYGTMLLNHVIDFAALKDFKRITLLTDKISAESQNFFRKHGFEYSNMIPMRRILSPSDG
jgi:ribosomal protein S18 acetylase RimI-like enzyme